MGDSVAVESWHLPRALSNEALRLLSSLPMEEIERRLRMDGPAVPEEPTDEQLDDLFVEIDGSGETQSWRAFARAVLARWGAADGEVAELTAEVRYLVRELRDRADDLSPSLELFGLIHRSADLLERQVLRPIPVSERLPGPEEMTDDQEVWVLYPGQEYPLGDAGDYDWDPHKWILSPIEKSTIRENRRWLPAHALPLPEVNDD